MKYLICLSNSIPVRRRATSVAALYMRISDDRMAPVVYSYRTLGKTIDASLARVWSHYRQRRSYLCWQRRTNSHELIWTRGHAILSRLNFWNLKPWSFLIGLVKSESFWTTIAVSIAWKPTRNMWGTWGGRCMWEFELHVFRRMMRFGGLWSDSMVLNGNCAHEL